MNQKLKLVKSAAEAENAKGKYGDSGAALRALQNDGAVDMARSALVLVGVNHTTAPIEVRERLSIPLTRSSPTLPSP